MARIRWPGKLNWQRASERTRRARRTGKGRKRRLQRRAALRLLLLRRPEPWPSVPAAAGSPSSLEKVADLPLAALPISSCCLVWWKRGAVAIRKGRWEGCWGSLHSAPVNPNPLLPPPQNFPSLALLVCSASSTDGRKRERGEKEKRPLLPSVPISSCPFR
jgi:hypothetical protein